MISFAKILCHDFDESLLLAGYGNPDMAERSLRIIFIWKSEDI